MDPAIAGLLGTVGGLVVGAGVGELQAIRRGKERERETRAAWERQAQREDVTWARDSLIERYSQYLADSAEVMRTLAANNRAERQQAFSSWRTASAALDLTAPEVVKQAQKAHAGPVRRTYTLVLKSERQQTTEDEAVIEDMVNRMTEEKLNRGELVDAMRVSLGLLPAAEEVD